MVPCCHIDGEASPSLDHCPAPLFDGFHISAVGRFTADLQPLLHARLVNGVAGWNPQCVQYCSLWCTSLSELPKVLLWHLCYHVRASFWTRQSRFSLFFHLLLLDCDDTCMLSIPLSTSDVHYSRWQSGEICQGLSTGAFTLLCHVFLVSVEGCSPFFFFWLSCPRVCLLDVSCLLGLTLRSSAPVCCCHRDSLTRGRLAFEQEAVRVSSSHSPRLVLHVGACARWFQAAFEKCVFKRC